MLRGFVAVPFSARAFVLLRGLCWAGGGACARAGGGACTGAGGGACAGSGSGACAGCCVLLNFLLRACLRPAGKHKYSTSP